MQELGQIIFLWLLLAIYSNVIRFFEINHHVQRISWKQYFLKQNGIGYNLVLIIILIDFLLLKYLTN